MEPKTKDDFQRDVQNFFLEDAKSTERTFKMLGGYVKVDDNGEKHLLNIVTLEEISGAEEDILADTKYEFTHRMRRVLANCMKEISNEDGSVSVSSKSELNRICGSLATSDRVYLLLLLRIISVENGGKFKFDVICPNQQCKKQTSHTVDLDKLEVFPMIDPLERVYDYKTKAGNVFRCKVHSGEDEEKSESLSNSRNKATDILSARILEMNGKKVNVSQLKSLKLRERNELRRMFDKKEGGVDTACIITCNHCGVSFEGEIDVRQRDFFFPAE